MFFILKEETFIFLQQYINIPVRVKTNIFTHQYTIQGYVFDKEGWHFNNSVISYKKILLFMKENGRSYLEIDDLKLMEMYFIN